MAKKLTRSSSKYISEPGEHVEYQSRLHHAPGFKQSQLRVFPPVSGDLSTLRDILATGGYKGNDWEFRPDLTPTICAVTTLDKIYSAPWGETYRQIFREAMLRGVAADGQRYRWVAHSTVGADKAVADKVFGITTNLADWDDSMISHYLANQHLVKAPDKDESDDAGSLGFMDLWSTASLVTDLSRWKGCRGAICPGPDPGTPGYSRLAPCPTHSPMSYCGVDAWVSPVAHLANMETLRTYGVPESFYRDMMELSEICHLMQQRGVKVDRPYVAKMSLVAEEKKAALFPVIAEGRHKTYAPFNPRSNPQVIAWFKDRKVTLKKIDKAAISEALDKLAKAEGFPLGLESINDDDDPQMSEALTALYNLNTFKIEGKGLDPWFHDKYLDEEGFAHPRFILTGTSTGRLSSSGPNFQNVPRRGIFGELVRGAIIPRDSSLKLLKSDFSQLEFRVCLYLGGEPYSGSDVFNWMVDQTGDSLYKVAKDFDPIKYEKDPQKAARDITKGVAHGCLTGDHEVLTPEGWVRIDQWNGQEIAEWSKEGTSVEFKRPLKYHSYETTPIYSITGPAFSQVATGNHRFPVATTGNSEGKKYICWQDMTPETWEGRNSGKLPVAGLHDYADPEFSDLDLQRAIAIQADGSTRGNGRWGFHVKKLRKVERLRQLFGDSPKLDADGTYRLTVNYDKPDLLTSDKKLSWGFLKTSLRQKKLCLREATLWDGSILKTSAVYNNSCLQSVSIMQTLSHLAGGQSKVNSAGIGGFEGSSKEVFRVSFNRRAMAAKDRLEVTPAGEAPVYCFTTHSGYFLVRHNGHVSVTGNSNYGEGMVLLDPKQLNDQHILKLVAAGALSIYTRKYKPWLKRDWTFHGKVVAFTGANLAERLFGSRSVENRAKALAIQEDIYFARFRAIREWQIRVLDKVQETGYVQSPTGRFLRLFGTPEEIAKVAIAFLGQGVGADHVQGIMLRFRREQNRIPILQVHDELVFEQDLSLTKAQSVEYIKLMEGETNRLPGFTCPVEAKWGPNWKDMETVYKNGEMVV